MKTKKVIDRNKKEELAAGITLEISSCHDDEYDETLEEATVRYADSSKTYYVGYHAVDSIVNPEDNGCFLYDSKYVINDMENGCVVFDVLNRREIDDRELKMQIKNSMSNRNTISQYSNVRQRKIAMI